MPINVNLVKASKGDLNALSGAKVGVGRMSTTFDLENGKELLDSSAGKQGRTYREVGMGVHNDFDLVQHMFILFEDRLRRA